MAESEKQAADSSAHDSDIIIRNKTINKIEADRVTVQGSRAEKIKANTAYLSQSSLQSLEADSAEIRQGGVQSANAKEIVVRQGGIVQAKADQLTLNQGGVVFAEAETVNLNHAKAGAMLVGQDAHFDQSLVRAMLTRGDVNMEQSGAGILLGRNVKVGDNTGVVLVLAGRIDGNVKAVFGPSASAAFGAGFAVVFAFLMWLRKRLF